MEHLWCPKTTLLVVTEKKEKKNRCFGLPVGHVLYYTGHVTVSTSALLIAADNGAVVCYLYLFDILCHVYSLSILNTSRRAHVCTSTDKSGFYPMIRICTKRWVEWCVFCSTHVTVLVVIFAWVVWTPTNLHLTDSTVRDCVQMVSVSKMDGLEWYKLAIVFVSVSVQLLRCFCRCLHTVGSMVVSLVWVPGSILHVVQLLLWSRDSIYQGCQTRDNSNHPPNLCHKLILSYIDVYHLPARLWDIWWSQSGDSHERNVRKYKRYMT